MLILLIEMVVRFFLCKENRQTVSPGCYMWRLRSVVCRAGVRSGRNMFASIDIKRLAGHAAGGVHAQESAELGDFIEADEALQG